MLVSVDRVNRAKVSLVELRMTSPVASVSSRTSERMSLMMQRQGSKYHQPGSPDDRSCRGAKAAKDGVIGLLRPAQTRTSDPVRIKATFFEH